MTRRLTTLWCTVAVAAAVLHVENYQRVEVTDQKAREFRATFRPFARSLPVLRRVRGHLVHQAPRRARLTMMDMAKLARVYRRRS